MPELPEVQALADFLTEKAVGHVVAGVEVAAISVLKTYDPPVTSLGGLTIDSVTRRGKFLDLDVSGLHLVTHLARAGWLQWRDTLPAGPAKPGKAPLALRVRLDDDSGFDLTEQGTEEAACGLRRQGPASRSRASPDSGRIRSIPRSTATRSRP